MELFERQRPDLRGAIPHSGQLDPDQSVNGSLQGLLMQKLAANSRGAIAVVNSTFTPGQRSRLWLIRGHAQED